MNIKLKVDYDRDSVYYINGKEIDNFNVDNNFLSSKEIEILQHSQYDNIPIDCEYSKTNIWWIQLKNKENELLYLCGAEIGKCLTGAINEIIKENGKWKMNSGKFAIGLHCPKNAINVGAALRAADAYGASLFAFDGKRLSLSTGTNVSHTEYKIPVIRGEDLHDMIPYGYIPVAVELCEKAENIIFFNHPKNAFYIFGAEDATLGKKTLSWCKYKIYIPTKICMNLAACVNVVLYDRIAKENKE
jgi:tRNA(Leu) C34 or U34 (ribose-2'-O)-methylase TrmL